MGVLIILLAIVIGLAAIGVGLMATVSLVEFGGGWYDAITLMFVGAALVGAVVLGRTGGHMQSETECNAVAAINENLDVQHITTTWWSFGCYVDTGNGVIPWGRYRAVIDG